MVAGMARHNMPQSTLIDILYCSSPLDSKKVNGLWAKTIFHTVLKSPAAYADNTRQSQTDGIYGRFSSALQPNALDEA